MFLTPKGIRSALKMHKCPLGDSNPIDWTLFLHFNERGNTSDITMFFPTKLNSIQLFIPN